MTDHSPVGREVRADIQALRAVAVSLVVIYHLFPARLTGGFIGVDTFFVISGYLITLHLIERPPRGGRDLLAFWARRVRRLLPAALTVLAVTVVAAWAFLPESQWAPTGVQARASALYVENWRLAADAVNYLAAENTPTAVQHFWSLSVEEQFYIGWPVLLLALTVLVPAAHRVRGYWFGLGSVVVLSLAYSIHLTASDPAAAYFVTWTRLWELGVGGLLALGASATGRWAQQHAAVGDALAAVGWCLVLAAAVFYTGGTPFPGWQAAVPVLGAVLVIAAHSRKSWYRVPGVQWLGNTSYSVYLWHWPLIVIVPVAVGKVTGSPERGPVESIVIVIATLVLAGLTKVYIEDGFRTPTWSRRVVVSLAAGAVGMTLVVILATSMVVTVHRQERDDARVVQAALAGSDRCLGAGALEPGNACPKDPPLVTSPVLAANDRSPAYDKRADGSDCFSAAFAFPLVTCQFGDPDGTVDVALVGNSHAAEWLPALQQIAATRHWRITTYLASMCTAADVPQDFAVAGGSAACMRWTRDAAAAIKQARPDLVVVANRTGRPALGEGSIDASIAKYTAGFRTSLESFAASGAPVVVIRDTPIPIYGGIDNVPDCLALHPDDRAACSGPRSVWLPADPSVAAAQQLVDQGVSVADLTDGFCDQTTCWGAIGGVIVYSDGHHVTRTYARTLAPRLDKILADRLGEN